MSHTVLRRIVIRLLHDPTFVDRVARDPFEALAGVDLSSEERGWLAGVPPSAWRTDPDRPRRVLSALQDEYPTTATLAPRRLASFFASIHFHDAVMDRGSLALAFGQHMAEDADARVSALARLELAMATVRRAPRRPPPSPPGSLRLAPAAVVVRTAGGASDLLAALRSGGPQPCLAAEDEPVLVMRTTDAADVTIEKLEIGLATVLDEAGEPRRRKDLTRIVRCLGADAAEAAALIDDLTAEGLLI